MTKKKRSLLEKVAMMGDVPSVLVANEPVTKPTYEELESTLADTYAFNQSLLEQVFDKKQELSESRANFARAYNALRNIRLYLRKHVDDIPYENRETLKRFCDAGGVTDTVLRASSSDLADVAFPPEET